MHEVLVNRLGGLSLPRKSVVRSTYRPDMTLDVYRGRKTTIQQQQHTTVYMNKGSKYFFHAQTFARPRGSCRKSSAKTEVFNSAKVVIAYLLQNKKMCKHYLRTYKISNFGPLKLDELRFIMKGVN